jgi:hypothetical protein
MVAADAAGITFCKMDGHEEECTNAFYLFVTITLPFSS